MIQTKARSGKRIFNRAILLAEAALLCIASSTTMAAIVDSGPVSISVPNDIYGIYINLITGATGTSGGAVSGYDMNPYSRGTTTGLGIFWCATNCGGVTATSGGNTLAVLLPGDSIGPTSFFTAAVAAPSPNFLGTQQAYLGVRFLNEGTSVVNYGYVQLSTTAPLGFPATIQRIVYENTGAAITIPVTALPLTSTPTSGATAAFALANVGGPSPTYPINFQNPGAAPVTVTCTAPTATQFTVAPLSFSVPAAGAASTTISFNTSTAGTFTGVLNCTAGAQSFTFNLAATAMATATGANVAIPTLSDSMRGLMALLMLALGMTAVGFYNRRN